MPLDLRTSPDAPRLVAGLMSGTSLDGVDAALARISGTGADVAVDPLGFVSLPYADELREAILHNSASETSSVRALALLNVRIAHAYAGAVRKLAEEAGVSVADVELVGSHGQTVHHVPEATDIAGTTVTATLQIGDPSVLANLLGIPVVGDFRVADMALGGQGAPLVPYFDWALFSEKDETRGLLNIGGIGNLTFLPAGCGREDVFAFDTGPGNMVIDALTQRFYREGYDRDGGHGAAGTILESVLEALLDEDNYFSLKPPKSTGRERYGAAYVERLIEKAGPDAVPDDLIATAAALTARSICLAVERFAGGVTALDVLIVAGGGVHNRFLMDRLSRCLRPVPVRSIKDYGIDPDAKEALCFALLAHETMNGVPTNLPAVTGASRPARLGKICLP